jgi:hypothetical protein
MSFGFHVVLLLALIAYSLATAAWLSLRGRAGFQTRGLGG